MAVYAAHLTRTLSGTPTVFQVAAQEALGNTVKPALRKLVEYLAVVYPTKCGWLVDWYDELYLVFDCCLQYHYLKHYAASFSESFYNLLRVPTQHSEEFSLGQRLPVWAERGSLLLLTLVPYVRDRVERLTQRWREDEEDGRLGKSPSDRLRAAAVRIYSVLHCVCELAKLTQLARYLTGRSSNPSLALRLLQLKLLDAPARVPSQEDYTWTDLFRSLATGQLGSAVVTFPMVGGLVLSGVQYGAFLVQFLRWWESRGAPQDAALPKPPPPQRDPAMSRWRNRCPLCLGAWRAPAALPPSGLVYCYSCIARHLRQHRACPATRLPATEDRLVRVYLDD